jgi:hypothetical protein
VRYLILTAVLATLAAAEKHTGPVSSEDEFLVVTGSAVPDRQSVIKTIGRDPGMDLIIVDVNLAPRGENKIAVNFDDFTLISRKDGQRSQPLAPAQIAGKGALVVAQGGTGGGGGMFSGSRGPIWGGAPGTGTRPKRVGGDGESGAVAGPTETKAAVTTGEKDKDNPLLALLKEKALPQVETNQPVTGLLYFFLEGKHKLKDLELMYKSPAGRLILDFEK